MGASPTCCAGSCINSMTDPANCEACGNIVCCVCFPTNHILTAISKTHWLYDHSVMELRPDVVQGHVSIWLLTLATVKRATQSYVRSIAPEICANPVNFICQPKSIQTVSFGSRGWRMFLWNVHSVPWFQAVLRSWACLRKSSEIVHIDEQTNLNLNANSVTLMTIVSRVDLHLNVCIALHPNLSVSIVAQALSQIQECTSWC